MPAAYSLTCPACGNPFLATLGESSTITTCPHCAFNGPVQSFAAAGIDRISHTPSIPLRRRDLRHRSVPPPTFPPHAVPPPPASTLVFPELNPPINPYQDHQARHFSPTSHPVGAPLSAHVPAHPALPPLTPAYPQLATPPQAPDRASELIAPPPATRPLHLPIGKILLFLSAFALIASATGFMYWENLQEYQRNRAADFAAAPSILRRTTAPELALSPPIEIRSAQAISDSSTPAPSAPLPIPTDPSLDADILAAEAPEFIQTFFNAPESKRPALLDSRPLDDVTLSAFFSRNPPVKGNSIKKLPVAPIDLVSGQSVSLFQVVTSTNPLGALARITRSADGNLKLHWPFFQQTHDSTLNQYVKDNTATAPAWFHVGIRRSHGLDLPSDTRNSHFVLDIQASADGLLGTHAVAAKELPPGRFIEQKSTWQTVYLCHLLLQKKTLSFGVQVLEVLDCSGASLTRKEG